MKRLWIVLLAAAAGWCSLNCGPAPGAAASVQKTVTAGTFGRLDDIASNDSVISGGTRTGNVLHIALVARWGLWYPDGPGTIGLPIEAFGEAGRPLQLPGPLIRAPLGTRVVASIRNELAHDLTVRGLTTTSAVPQAILRIPSGATRRTTFTLDRAGAFGYYGSDFGESLDGRMFGDAELSGAIVVERPHAAPIDHIFVLGVYAPVKEANGDPNFLYMLETINGRAFPATQHLSYRRGQHVHWAVVNLSAMTHPMHLHGFYFRVDRPSAYDEVTHAFHPGDAAELSWVADRAGTWMYHCHISDHISRHAPLADMRAGKAAPQLSLTQNPRAAVAKRFHLADQPMGGMVVAITVQPRSGSDTAVTDSTTAATRRLALTIDAHDQAAPPYPGLTKDLLTLTEGTRSAQSSGNAGPPIVLMRGQPVAIAVTNHTPEQTSMHWHGIALQDSYYDGGAGMGMSMGQNGMSPPIESNATFVAQFTPPDAGTFMYHAHMDDGWQLGSGIDGALLVLPPGETFDSSTDHVVMISESYERAGSPYVAINGSLKPAPLSATVGVPQRLRLAVLTLGGQDLVVSLSDGSRVMQWTPIAKDGRDLPPSLRHERNATQAFTIGETRDFRFTPRSTGSLTLGIYDLDNNGRLVGTQRIDVRP
jgi:manganese oxidase